MARRLDPFTISLLCGCGILLGFLLIAMGISRGYLLIGLSQAFGYTDWSRAGQDLACYSITAVTGLYIVARCGRKLVLSVRSLRR